jgi:hypothetical protein
MIRAQSLGVVAVTVLAVVAAACSGGGGSKAPSALVVVTTTSTTTPLDYSSVSLAAVAGATTMTISLTPGTSTINGQVLSDTGQPLPGADVHIERVVGNATAATDTATRADGTFAVPGLLGGVYRVRAWLPPDLALTTPQIFFLTEGQTYPLTLQLQKFTGIQVSASIAPNPPIVTEPANVAVQVTTATVGADGVVRGQGAANLPVQLFGSGAWAIDGPGTSTTNADGVVTWQVTCDTLGAQDLSVLVAGSQSFPLNLPGCVPVPTTTTSTTTTTTLVRGGRTTSTTTP